MKGEWPQEPELDPKAFIRRGIFSRRSRLHRPQARFVARLIRELESALIHLFRVPSAQHLRFQWDGAIKPWDAPEYHRFIEGLEACAFVCGDYPKPEMVALVLVNREPTRILGGHNTEGLRRYLHTLHRAEKWEEGATSPILESLAAGALQVVADRLENDEGLYEPIR